ncbi:uncharacterized protein LAJ45_02640 [Morchella importuna]|uniref:uncharacterized protein n=1 Tax=Morchella importuna TaxID=1174673 RepID=UPI001E8D0ACF|nr:uncharacterized protein LAJ45_02640 [Morchella importuna]KAH8153053.1 hypothetical protein LAJ45_02640 [Morchella importuna]
MLLDGGADIEHRDSSGRTPLYISVELENESITRLLLEGGANTSAICGEVGGKTPHISGNPQGEPATPTKKGIVEVSTVGPKGQTRLHTSVAKTSKFRSQDISPPHAAVRRGNAATTELLLKKGADASETGLFRRTPLDVSLRREKEAMIKILLENDVDPSEAGDDGQPPLHLSAEGYNSAITRLLLDNGAEMSIVDHNGNTPLHVACSRKPLDRRLNNASILETVSLMLERGADVTATDGEGRTPLELTTCYYNPELASLLGTVAVKS